MSEENVLANQQTIIQNQETILKNQANLQKNQETILKNQATIVANQSGILSNQAQIVDNQVALSVISQTQVYILNTLKKVAGEKESLKATGEFLAGLRAKAEKSVKSKKLAGPKKI
ncbi:MAG: hypothetical protein QM791_16575 [Ferruginibacter sp.]